VTQTICSNCGTTQGPFKRMQLVYFPSAEVSYPLCKNDLDGCKKRRDALDRKNWAINKGDVLIKDE